MVKKKRTKKRTRPLRRTASVRKKPLLTMAMMVKNEEGFLEDALASAKGFCDELVVVDTGSTDRSVEIARDMGAKVSFFEWCDSFSKARNVTLRRSTGEWVIILDADERFRGRNPGAIRQHLVRSEHWPYQALMLNVINTRLDGSPISSFFSVRVFPNDDRLGYSGRVHNRFGALVPDAPKIQASRYMDLEIVHLGYDPELYAARKKAARSLPLIEATVREEPDNHQQRYYLGREYLLLDRVEDAVSALTLAFEGIIKSPGGPLAETTAHLMQALGRAETDPALALKFGERALQARPDHPDIWFEMGRALLRAQAPQRAVECLQKSLACLQQTVIDGQVRLRHYTWEAFELLGSAYWALNQYPQSYAAYSKALEGKPENSGGWPRMLNSLCGLAIDLGDHARLPDLLERLLAYPTAPLGMFFFEVDRVARSKGVDAAREMLAAAASRHPRVLQDPEFTHRLNRFGSP